MPDYSAVLCRFSCVRQGSRGTCWNVRCPCTWNHEGGDKKPSGRVWIDEESGRLCWHCYKGCKWKEVLTATGTVPQDWFQVRKERGYRKEQKMDGRGESKIVAVYPYEDELGHVLYEVCRTEPKGFFQRLPGGQLNLTGVRRVPYRLPKLTAELTRTVFVVEGEKDVHTLEALGFLATTNAGGAKKWPANFGQYLAWRPVVIWPDNDETGREHAYMVATSAICYRAASVTIVPPHVFSIPAGGDVTDFLAEMYDDPHHKRHRVIEAVKNHAFSWLPGAFPRSLHW